MEVDPQTDDENLPDANSTNPPADFSDSNLLDQNPRSPFVVAEAVSSPHSPHVHVASEVIVNGSEEAHVVSKDGVLAINTSNAGSVSIALHPLVIMNVAEHWVRTKAQYEHTATNGNTSSAPIVPPPKVLGALIGRQKGRNLEVMNSFELRFLFIEGNLIVDRDYYESKENQFKQVFPDLDFLGWYTIGDSPTLEDIEIHRQICEINESPIFMKLNPSSKHSRLPISIFESVIDLVNGQATLLFSPVTFSLATEEAERIGLDHMARLSSNSSKSNGSGSSVAAEHLRVQYNAVKMLRDRVKLIRDFVVDSKDGKVAWNHEILREAFNLSNRLPLINSSNFKSEFFNQCNDVALMTYLGMLTKTTNALNQYVVNFNILHERPGIGRRPIRGIYPL